ncbi:hypothetical protein PPL_05392 [Heterostelium album PN500]|uniref:Uncharacterized protein n=1 Tax=Heterostelium pallidum (strain ATCC 26659 / Pp 5 / PN500) TaxID=670386 RepID=D3BA20_HETP5|nr:hypothetical protein PPL_05392 [Heterostelium album PN500]EFA81407.1 hypothetical protein PPL_05392 [Heterostelium album PN500]|eukprot:XP_020433525.1 hypothetical protein PPL_05392 [Heterostelium album PN500]
MKQITFIIFLILLTIKVSESVTCVNPEGKAVKWWIHLADADSATEENMYARGLYYDSLLDLMKKHVDQANGDKITEQQCIDKNYLGLEWYHDQGYEHRVIDNSVFYHGHVKSLYVFDLRDNDIDSNTGFFVSHSMRMPELKSTGSGLYEKAKWYSTITTCILIHTQLPKKYCMENEGPFTLGSFTTFSFSADKENDKKNYKTLSKCFALNYGKKIQNIKFENDFTFENKDNPIKVDMLSTTHCLSNDVPKDDSICYDAKTVCSFTDFGMDPYLLVAQHYDSHFFVSTDQETFPSLIGSTFSVRNIVTWSPIWSREKKDGENSESRSRHEKLMVSKSKNIICLGDSNRNDYSVHHAGTIFCIENEILAKRVHESIRSFNTYRQFNFGDDKRKGFGDIKINHNSPFEDVKPVCYLYAQSLYHPIAKVSYDMKFYKRKGSIPLTNSNITPGEPSRDQIESEKIKQAIDGLKPGQPPTRQHTKHIKVDEEYAKKRAIEDPFSQQLKKKRK